MVGPRTWPMAGCTMNLREEDTWQHCMRGPNEADASWGMAVFEQVVGPERLVCRDDFTEVASNVNEQMPTYLTRLALTDEDGRARITGRGSSERIGSRETPPKEEAPLRPLP